uniref:Secreted protein n=1 Tax=Achlya hypogyna TaxID=1202772 RepID=A0A0A7CNU9_ACHHY|nr:secreted protein [Achlya hypogyna]
MIVHATSCAVWWAAVASTAVFLFNRTPNSKTGSVTPHELITGQRPNIANLKVFGCICYLKNDTKSKLASEANRCIFLGYSDQHKAYKLWDLEVRKCVIAIDVKFLESTFPNPNITVTDGPVDDKITTSKSAPTSWPYVATPASSITRTTRGQPSRLATSLSIGSKFQRWSRPTTNTNVRSLLRRVCHCKDESQ